MACTFTLSKISLATICFSIILPSICMAQSNTSTNIAVNQFTALIVAGTNKSADDAFKLMNRIPKIKRDKRGRIKKIRPAKELVFNSGPSISQCRNGGYLQISDSLIANRESLPTITFSGLGSATYASCDGLTGTTVLNSSGSVNRNGGSVSTLGEVDLSIDCLGQAGSLIASYSETLTLKKSRKSFRPLQRSTVTGRFSLSCGSLFTVTCNWDGIDINDRSQMLNACSYYGYAF